MSYTNVLHLGNTQQEWLRKLDFYATEMEFLQGRLSEIILKNTHHTPLSEAEHFQNQFIVQRNNIDELKHTINVHAHLVSEDSRHHAGRVEGTLIDDQEQIEAEVTTLESIVKDIRLDFNKFLAKWM